MGTSEATAAPSEQMGHILVVDDEDGVRTMLRVVLEAAQYAVAVATDAEEALSVVRELDVVVALIDINLPDLSGLELCQRFREENDVDVIIMTGDDRHYSFEDAAKSGAHDFILKPLKPRELVLRVERAIEARQMRESRQSAMQELERVAITDALTGLFNSRHFFEEIAAEIARSERYGHSLSLILADLDHFKQINDSHGHQEGDRALQRVAAAIRNGIRETDSAYRYGGEEFTVVLPETDLAAAQSVAERLLSEIVAAKLTTAENNEIALTASMGVAQWEEGEDFKALLRRADAAMYASKEAGRARVSAAAPGVTPDEQ